MKKDISDEDTKMDVSFEKVVDDLLMISISSQRQDGGILSYWRLTKVIGIPPLEIGIDCKKGELVSATFYVDTSYIKEQEIIDVPSDKGNVLVDTNIFTKVNDYVDVDKTYEIGMLEDKIICLFVRINEFKQSYKNGRFEVYVDSKNQIVGFAVCDLSKEEIDIFNSL